MSSQVNRRDFMKALGLTAMGLALSPYVRTARGRGRLQAAGQPQNVVILGGGLAGLAAAYELKRAGHKVTILEARKSPGGRVRTLRTFSDGLYAEAGPNSFPQDHSFTWGYANDFNLPLRPAFKPGYESVGYLRGSRFRIAGDGKAEVPFGLKSSEREKGVYALPALYLEDYMRDVGNPRRADWPPDNLRALDDISLEQLLRDRSASDGAIELIQASQLGLLGEGIGSISALDGVVTEKIASGGLFYEIAGGNDQLPNALKKKVKKNFKKQAVVLRIEQNETGVSVTYAQSGEIRTITADRCICTLPFSVLKDIDVSPAFSEEKQAAIRDLKMTAVTRTYLQFRSRIWEQDRLSGAALTDLTIQNVYSPTITQPGSRGVLTSYAGGPRALELGAMTEDEREDAVIGGMGNIFSGLRSQLERSVSQIWQDDEWARGGFAYFQPGQMTRLLPVAQRPEGRIHFAGEHTSAWHGWMNGALESGNRAAEEVNEAESAAQIVIRTGG